MTDGHHKIHPDGETAQQRPRKQSPPRWNRSVHPRSATCISSALPSSRASSWTGAKTRPCRHRIVKITSAITSTIIIWQIIHFIYCSSAYGGGGGIRTPGAVSRTTVFKTVAIDHSATPPANHSPRLAPPRWQGGRDSNPQPTVLETATLPIELPPYAVEWSLIPPQEPLARLLP